MPEDQICQRVILLTATVTPPSDVRGLQRLDPVLRLNDYKEALGFYLKLLDAGVVDSVIFSDNSNSDISVLKTLASGSSKSKSVEFLSFCGLDYPSEYGRGYGELKLVEYTMNQSKKISEAGANSVVWKITGRYVVENIQRLFATESDAVMFCHCRNHPKRWVDMYFMGWKKSAYHALFDGAAEQVREDHARTSAEEALREFIDERARSLPIQRRLPEPPLISGYRGWDNVSYQTQTFKRSLRYLAGRCFPWIWI